VPKPFYDGAVETSSLILSHDLAGESRGFCKILYQVSRSVSRSTINKHNFESILRIVKRLKILQSCLNDSSFIVDWYDQENGWHPRVWKPACSAGLLHTPQTQAYDAEAQIEQAEREQDPYASHDDGFKEFEQNCINSLVFAGSVGKPVP
jgi:hypothetical protein